MVISGFGDVSGDLWLIKEDGVVVVSADVLVQTSVHREQSLAVRACGE